MNPSKHRCPRCGETGDPRICNCMDRLSRHVREAQRNLKLGRTIHAAGELHRADQLLELLALDARKQAGDRRSERRAA